MKIVILERNSVGTDVSVDALGKYGELTIHRNTTAPDVAERVKDVDIIIANSQISFTLGASFKVASFKGALFAIIISASFTLSATSGAVVLR